MSKAVELKDSEVAVELVQFAYFKKVSAEPFGCCKDKTFQIGGTTVLGSLLQVLEKDKKRSKRDRDSGSEDEEEEEEEASTQRSQKTTRKRSACRR